MVELGPGSGENGGHAWCSPARSSRVSESPLTGNYLTGAAHHSRFPRPAPCRARWLDADRRARAQPQERQHPHPARHASRRHRGDPAAARARSSTMCSMRALETSPHGESTAKQHLGESVGEYDTLTGFEALEDVVLVDQSPIGKCPRSNPVTYVKAFDEIRRLFAALPLSRQQRYTAGTFSFNVKGGRCDTCEGAGLRGSGDGIHGRRVRAVRRLRRQALQARGAGGEVTSAQNITTCWNSPWTRPSASFRTRRNSGRRCGNCSRWASATCALASLPRHCPAASHSGSRSRGNS